MASIPLPALSVHTQDPNEGFNRLAALMQMKQQQALMPGQLQAQQQQLQAGAQENQMRQQQITDQQALTKALQEWDGKDYNALPGLVVKHGASATAVMGLKSSLLEQQQKLATLSKDQLANEKVKNDYLAQLVDNVKGLPPEQQPQAFEAAKADAVKRGYLDAQSAQGMQYQGPQQLDLLEKSLMGHAGAVADAEKHSSTAKNTAQAGEATAQTNKINTEINPDNPSDPNIRKQKYEGILQKIQEGGGLSAVTPQEINFAKSYEFGQRKTTTQSDSLGVTSSNVSAPSGISAAIQASRKGGQTQSGPGPAAAPGGNTNAPVSGAPAQKPANAKDSMVDMIGNYKLAPTMLQRMMAKHPDVIAAVGQKYPDWNQPQYNAINHMVTGYTSGTQAKEINAINTAMGHIKNLDDAVDALNNSNMTALNKIGAYYNINMGGKTPEAAFKLIVHRVGPEIANAYIPGGGGQGERMADEKDFDVNLPPQTLHNNAAVTVNMLRSKIGALENQYKSTVGRDDFNTRFITPEARASLQKMAPGNTGTGTKVLSMAQIEQAAKDHGVSVDEAKRQAQAAGYQVK